MSLSDLASLGSFVSGVAVFISLIYLASQVRHAKRSLKVATRSARTDRTLNIILTRLEPSVAQAMLNGSAAADDISPLEYEQFRSYARAAFFNLQRSFMDHHDGALDELEFEASGRNAQFFLGRPGARSEWELQRGGFGPEFVAWIDRLVAAAPAADSEGSLSRWKAANAARRATVQRAG